MPMRSQPLILIADDDPGFQEIIGAKLKRNGYLIAEALDGREAVEKAGNLHPDLILMDIDMPGETGTEAVLDLKKNPETKDIQVVFLTGLNEPWPAVNPEQNEKLAKELGALQFLSKTEDLDIITEKIKTLLKQ